MRYLSAVLLLGVTVETAADETPVVLDSDTTIDYTIDEAVWIARGDDPPTVVSVVDPASIAGVLVLDSSILDIGGGSIEGVVEAGGTSMMYLSGGVLREGLSVSGSGSVEISGGEVLGGLQVGGNGSIDIRGGQVDLLTPTGSSTVDISGGSIGSVNATGSARLRNVGVLGLDGSFFLGGSSEYAGLVGEENTSRVQADAASFASGARLAFWVSGADMFKAGDHLLIESAADLEGTLHSTTGLGAYVTGDGLAYAADRLLVTTDYDLNPGDANLDTITDVRDFNVWNAHKFTDNTEWISGDFTGDGITDVRDFNQWNAAKFTSATGGAALVEGQVPEPATLTLLVLSVLFLTGYAWRRRWRPPA